MVKFDGEKLKDEINYGIWSSRAFSHLQEKNLVRSFDDEQHLDIHVFRITV